MATTKITCENCGFEEELTQGQLEERTADGADLNCKQCGAKASLPQAGQAEPGSQAQSSAEAKGEAQDKSEEASAGQEKTDKTKAEAAKESAKHAAEAAKEKLKEAIAEGRKNPVFIANLFSACLKKIAGGESDKCFSRRDTMITIGHYALLLAAAFSLIMGVIVSLRTLSFTPLAFGILTTALLLFAQYLAIKGFALLEGYIENNPSKMPGESLLEILSALSLLIALGSLICTVALTIANLNPIFLGVGVALFVGCYYLAAAYLRYGSQLNITLDEKMPTSLIIIELVAAKIKALVAVVPYVFGIGSAVMAIALAWPAFSMAIFGLTPLNSYSLPLQQAGLLLCAFSPILLYFLIILYSFIIDVARGLLKLAKLK